MRIFPNSNTYYKVKLFISTLSYDDDL